jgi:hypothetical protein
MLFKKCMKILKNYIEDNLLCDRPGLFVFSDPGGAKPILAFIYLNNISSSSIVYTDRQYDFFDDYPGIKIIKYTNQNIEKLIDTHLPSFVFTGTSYTSKIELLFLEAANNKKISTFSFIDHYSNHIERFHLGDKIILPNTICYPNLKIAEISKNKFNGIEKCIFPNYHHKFLENWSPTISKSQFASKLGIGNNKKILLFAPDPISNIGGVIKYGIDEVTSWNLLIKNLESLDVNSFVIILKLHPNQNLDYFFKNAFKSVKLEIIYLNDLGTNSLIYFSDIIVGMFSNLLVEAIIMKKKVIRCLINYKGEDPFMNDNIGYCIRRELDFKDILNKLL